MLTAHKLRRRLRARRARKLAAVDEPRELGLGVVSAVHAHGAGGGAGAVGAGAAEARCALAAVVPRLAEIVRRGHKRVGKRL